MAVLEDTPIAKPSAVQPEISSTLPSKGTIMHSIADVATHYQAIAELQYMMNKGHQHLTQQMEMNTVDNRKLLTVAEQVMRISLH